MSIFNIKNNLRNKLVLSFMSTYLIPILVILVLVFVYTWRDNRTSTLNELQSMSDTKAEQITDYVLEK